MMENIEKLTGEEIEAVIFVIYLIYSGDSEIVNENTAVVGIFREVLGKLLRVNLSHRMRYIIQRGSKAYSGIMPGAYTSIKGKIQLQK